MKKQWNSKDKWRKENDKPKKKQEKRYNRAGVRIEGDRPPRRKFINGEEA